MQNSSVLMTSNSKEPILKKELIYLQEAGGKVCFSSNIPPLEKLKYTNDTVFYHEIDLSILHFQQLTNH